MTNEDIYKNFGQRLKQLRKEHGLTQTQLAEVIDVTQSSIYHYEKGNRKIPMSVLEKFAAFFEMSMSELIDVQPVTNEHTYIDEIKSYNLSENEIHDLMNYLRFIITKRK